MKHQTAVQRLIGLAEEADRYAAMPGLDWPLHEMWAAGELLGGRATLDVVTVILMLDVPVVELPWLALHPSEQAVADMLRLSKLPVRRYARPFGGPAWNPLFRWVVRFWDVASGLDEQVTEALLEGERVEGVEPSTEECLQQMEAELIQCRAHLDAMLAHFWEPNWRREHRGGGIYPEEHLWRAAQAVREVEAALDQHLEDR